MRRSPVRAAHVDEQVGGCFSAVNLGVRAQRDVITAHDARVLRSDAASRHVGKRARATSSSPQGVTQSRPAKEPRRRDREGRSLVEVRDPTRG